MPPKKKKGSKRALQVAPEEPVKKAKTESESTKEDRFTDALIANDVFALRDVITGDDAANVNAKILTEPAIMYSLRLGHYDVAEALVDAGCKLNHTKQVSPGTIYNTLHYAVQSGRLELLRKIIQSRSGKTLLGKVVSFEEVPATLAVNDGRTDMLKLLVENGCVLNAGNPSPLCAATCRGERETVEYLLDYGADPVLCPDAFHKALDQENDDMANLLLDNTNVKGLELKHIRSAVKNGKKRFIEKLIAKGLDMKRWGTGYLCAAIEFNQEEIFDLFLDAGCPMSGLNEENPLEKALKDDRSTFVRKVLEAERTTEGTCDVTRPFIQVCRKGMLDLVRLFVEKGAPVDMEITKMVTEKTPLGRFGRVDGESTKEDIGHTPLGAAALEGHVDVVKFLISNGADVNYVPGGKDTALYCACVGGHEDIVNLLLKKSANPTACGKEANLRSPLVGAIDIGNCKIVCSLVKAGYNIKEKASYVAAVKDFRFPLARAAELGHSDIVGLLIKKGADVNETFHQYDNESPPALWLAAKEGRLEVVKILLKAGADVTVTDYKTGLTILMASVYGYWLVTHEVPSQKAPPDDFLTTTETLLRSGCQIEQKSRNGKETLLMYAIAALPSGHDLIRRIANESGPLDVPLRCPNRVTRHRYRSAFAVVHEEKTPLQWAAQNVRNESMEILMDCGASLAAEEWWINREFKSLPFLRSNKYLAKELAAYDKMRTKQRIKSQKLSNKKTKK